MAALILVVCLALLGLTSAREIVIQNALDSTISVGVWGQGGFDLGAGEQESVPVPDDWTSGRIWVTNGGPPQSLAEFTFSGGTDYYDVSLVDGFNVPILIQPDDQGCKTVGCQANLLDGCEDTTNGACVNSGSFQDRCNSQCEAAYCYPEDDSKLATCGSTNYHITIGY